MDLEKYKLKRLIKTLGKARGIGTSVVTVMIPANYQINLIRQLLTDEYSTATNIKSRVNKLSVLSAITSAQTRLKQYKQTPPNGLALFCGEVVGEDSKSKKFVFPDKCLCGSKTKKELSESTKKLDAVRRCMRGYECKFIAREKLKHLVSKEALNIDGLGKKVIDQLWSLNL